MVSVNFYVCKCNRIPINNLRHKINENEMFLISTQNGSRSRISYIDLDVTNLIK